LSKTADGNYSIFGDTFGALPSNLGAKAKAYLKEARRQIQPENVPEFFEHELPSLKDALETELTAEAKKIRIVDEPLMPTSKIDYDPDQGLSIQTGYLLGETEELVADSDLQKTADGRHAVFGTDFVALPGSLTETAAGFLRVFHRHVPKEEIPGFLKKDIHQLEDAFNVELADSTKAIKILDEPMKPTAVIDFNPERGLDVQTGYSVEGIDGLVHVSDLSKTADGKYAIFSDTFVALPSNLGNKAKAYLKDNPRLPQLRELNSDLGRAWFFHPDPQVHVRQQRGRGLHFRLGAPGHR
jgi:hypothetical protein